MLKRKIKPLRLQIVTIILSLIVCLNGINQRCTPSQNKSQSHNQNLYDGGCPQNSYCNSLGFCVCDYGYFGNCQNKGQHLNNDPKEATINQSLSYFLIQPTLNQYVYYQFVLCNQEQKENEELLNLWDDDGTLQTPTSRNALGVDKNINTNQGCTSLMTPFFMFQNQPNGQKEMLIFGIRLKNPGTLKIKVYVQQAELFGFDILFRIVLILLSGIALISIAGVIYCIYKCRRRNRRNLLHQQNYNIQFFQEYMPTNKAKLKQLRQQICSVCLSQYKQDQQIRPTICGHCFHKTCLDQWCVTNLSCPICRTSFQKANLIHHQYLMSRQTSTHEREDSIIEDDIINQQNIRKPMV